MSKQYKFKSRSAFSFAVQHQGRQVYVNFSAAYRGLSFYITKDEKLAEKIRQHRWFKQGRITEEVVEIKPRQPEPAYVPKAPEPPKPYSILGKSMTGGQKQKREAVIEQAAKAIEQSMPAASEPAEQEKQQDSGAFRAEDVTSFMEAKEFFITNFGVSRSECATKEALSALCREFNVEFPNYPL